MTREGHVRFCEGPKVKFLRPTLLGRRTTNYRIIAEGMQRRARPIPHPGVKLPVLGAAAISGLRASGRESRGGSTFQLDDLTLGVPAICDGFGRKPGSGGCRFWAVELNRSQ
jgi:hypothetical protein